MEPVIAVLRKLASQHVKLALEGENIRCYAPKGSVTAEIRGCIARNKPMLVHLLKGYADSRRTWMEETVDLEEEAVLDPDIQLPAAFGGTAEFGVAKSILLTGASGFLGAYLLHDLLVTTEASLYCLVRAASENEGGERIKRNLVRYGLWRDSFTPRIAPVLGDLTRPLLGLTPAAFDNLSNEIDAIYHNGAVVNFIAPYANLKLANVGGMTEVIRLACHLRPKPLHYVSTIGVFPPTADREIRILESSVPGDWRGLIGGYQQSKWVAEKLVTLAAARGLPVRIYRPGFVAGDSRSGVWNTEDFLPRLIKGCIQLGIAPDSDAMLEMVPVDFVSKIIVRLSCQCELKSGVFHIVSPQYISARGLLRIVGSLGYEMKVVSHSEWRAALLEDAKASADNALYPLLPMFLSDGPVKWVPLFDCRQTLEGLGGAQLVCPEIDTNLMSTYLAYFRKCGFLAAPTAKPREPESSIETMFALEDTWPAFVAGNSVP